MTHAGAASSSTLLVGDSVIDWKTARAASAHVCLARYGFGFEEFPLDEIAPSDRIIDSPDALITA